MSQLVLGTLQVISEGIICIGLPIDTVIEKLDEAEGLVVTVISCMVEMP